MLFFFDSRFYLGRSTLPDLFPVREPVLSLILFREERKGIDKEELAAHEA